MSVTIYGIDAIDGWLALASHAGHAIRRAGRQRRMADERAAWVARMAALAACGSRSGQLSLSVSHTEGSAAVLAGAANHVFGIDLVRIERVSPRHSRAILTPGDAAAFGTLPAPYRDALAWALKEAAAKASGAAQHYFPGGVRLTMDALTGRLGVRLASATAVTLNAAWFVSGDLLCAIVSGTPTCVRSAQSFVYIRQSSAAPDAGLPRTAHEILGRLEATTTCQTN